MIQISRQTGNEGFHTVYFANSWKQGIWDDIVDLNTITEKKEDETTFISLTPTATFVFLFIQLYHDFIEGQPIEGQIIAWKYYIVDHNSEIITDSAIATLDKLGLVRACCAFGYILANQYNMDDSFFPLPIKDMDKRYKVSIMKEIQHTNSSLKRLLRFFWLSPWDNILWLPKAIKQTIKKS